jgi:hypothetical protein
MSRKFRKSDSALVLTTESKEKYEALVAAYRAEYNPQGPIENHLVEELVAAEWLQRRYRALHTALLRLTEEKRIKHNTARTLALLDRFAARHAREYERAAATLREIQRERRKAQNTKIRNEPGKGLTRVESAASKYPIWLQ